MSLLHPLIDALIMRVRNKKKCNFSYSSNREIKIPLYWIAAWSLLISHQASASVTVRLHFKLKIFHSQNARFFTACQYFEWNGKARGIASKIHNLGFEVLFRLKISVTRDSSEADRRFNMGENLADCNILFQSLHYIAWMNS